MRHSIKVIGLGGGDVDQLPLGIYRQLTNTKESKFIRTENHPVVKDLREEGIVFTSFDAVYEQESHFEDIYERIVQRLLQEARKESILYAVPGHPMLAERTVQLLLAQKEIPVEIMGGQSFLDDLFTALKIDPIEGFQFMDATYFQRSELNFQNHLIFCQVYDYFVASEVKLTLLEDLPIDQPITVVTAAGSKAEKIETIPLQALDRYEDINHLTSIYVPPVAKEHLNHTFARLREVIQILRGPNGCEWDRAQTHESLREYALEEVYELMDAIDAKDDENIVEELGDVLLQVLLHSQIGEDHGYFSVDDVILSTTEKMLHRHPHVFGKVDVDSLEEIEQNWEALKAEEQGSVPDSLLDGVPTSMPGLMRAYKVQEKAATVGFDWTDKEEVWEKLREELQEVHEAIEQENVKKIEKEFGDVLFSIVNLMRHYAVHPELALTQTIQKFMRRFQMMEKKIKDPGKNMPRMSLQELDLYWEEAKEGEDEDAFR